MPPAHYSVTVSAEYLADHRALHAYVRPRIFAALQALATQAETVTRNRRPLEAPISWCPAATWQLRVGEFRVLYRVDGSVVVVLRVRFKGSGTTEEMGP